jgi:hypothetical protein
MPLPFTISRRGRVALRDLDGRHDGRIPDRRGSGYRRRRLAAQYRQVAPQVVLLQARRLATHDGRAFWLPQAFEHERQVLPGQRIERVEQARLLQRRQGLRIASAQIIGMAEIAEQVGLLRLRRTRFLRQGQPMRDRRVMLAALRVQDGQAVARIHMARCGAQGALIGRLRRRQITLVEILAPRHIGGIGVRRRRVRRVAGAGTQAQAGTGGGQAGERQAHGSSFQRLAMAGTSTR